jgi:hypothetical protein
MHKLDASKQWVEISCVGDCKVQIFKVGGGVGEWDKKDRV